MKTNDSGALLCPICGHDFTHLEALGSDLGGTGKRLNGWLEFSCEKGCTFTFDVQQHRGRTYVAHSGHDNSHFPEQQAAVIAKHAGE